jgi:hypothetical protein
MKGPFNYGRWTAILDKVELLKPGQILTVDCRRPRDLHNFQAAMDQRNPSLRLYHRSGLLIGRYKDKILVTRNAIPRTN